MPKSFASILGMSFGELTVVSEFHDPKHPRVRCLCKCSCGVTRDFTRSEVRTYKHPDCGHSKTRKTPREDFVGVVLGSFTVKSYLARSRWSIECACGLTAFVSTSRIKKGLAPRCKCQPYVRPIKHGAAKRKLRSPEYAAWIAMNMRCDPSSAYVKKQNYSARGITVCERWSSSYSNFYADMGPRPSDQHSLDRIDPNGNYEPSNCRWATVEQQVNNRRNSLFLDFAGQRLTIGQWANQLGKCRETLRTRYHKGDSPAEILFGKGEQWTLM